MTHEQFRKKFYKYEELKKLVNEAGIKTLDEYYKMYKTLTSPDGIKAPRSVGVFYKRHGFTNTKEFLSPENLKEYTYEEYKTVVKQYNIKRAVEYTKRINEIKCDGYNKIGCRPELKFKDKGWINWQEFLREDFDKFYDYETLKELVKQYKINNQQEYKQKYKELNSKSGKAMSSPNNYYKEWCGWHNFLEPDKKWIYYELYELKEIVISLKIKSSQEYSKIKNTLTSSNGKIAPSDMRKVYGEEWPGWVEFLNKNKRRDQSNYFKYEELRELIQKLGIINQCQYRKTYKTIEKEYGLKAPRAVCEFYFNNRSNMWHDFFGEKYKYKDHGKKPINIYSYNELKYIVNQKNIITKSEYLKLYKTFEDENGNCAVRKPEEYYQNNGWLNWDIFLNTYKEPKHDKIKKQFYSYSNLKKIVNKLGIKTQIEYHSTYLLLTNENGVQAPAAPDQFKAYGGEWTNYSDFLNTKNVFYEYKELKDVIKEKGVKSGADYILRLKELTNIHGVKAPARPQDRYPDWEGWHKVIPKNARKIQYMGEIKVKWFLDNNNFEYTQNKPIGECKYIQKLKFDFYIPKSNICIEYDGLQHFKPVLEFGGEKGFVTGKIRDGIKDKYCEDNGIKMIRLPYWLSNEEIYNILEKELITNNFKNDKSTNTKNSKRNSRN